MAIELVPVDEPDRSVLANLMQFYLYDFSPVRDLVLSPHGTYTYRWLDTYFTEPDREPYFITVDGELAGFALARGDADDDGSWNLSEFFVVRRHRRKGVAREAARLLFARHPGEWTLSFDHNNKPAEALWRSVASALATGPVTEIDRFPPEAEAAATRLRFPVK